MGRSNARRRTRRVGALGGVAALLIVSVASAAPRPRAGKPPKPPSPCAVAYKAAQDAEAAGHLRAASAMLRVCSKASCDAALMRECTAMRAQVDSDLPTFVPSVTDEAGAARTDFEVRVDGERMTSETDGRAFPIDPGEHEITFTTDSGASGEQKFALVTTVKVDIEASDRNRTIAITLPPSGKRPPALVPPTEDSRKLAQPRAIEGPPLEIGPRTGGRSVLPYVLGGAGLAAIAGGALLTYWGRQDNDKLALCSPNCRQESVAHIQTMYVAADISMGVGAVAVGIATVLFLTRSKESTSPPRSAYAVDVKPTASGAFTSLSGSF